MNRIMLLLFFTLISHTGMAAPKYVESCDRTLHIDAPPTRAVSHDINLTEMMFALGLQDRMVGYTGVSGWQKLTPEFKQNAMQVPQLAAKTPTMETLLAVNADFFFAGWRYGMRPGGPLTPHTLQPFGITVYELTESCIHITTKKTSSFEDVYRDIRNLGTIFGVTSRSDALVSALESEVRAIRGQVSLAKNLTSVFVYDSGTTSPFTAGEFAIPTAMIEAAGGKNVMNDLKSSWGLTNWEIVVDRNPEVIIIVNYGNTTAEDKQQFLLHHPALSNVSAITNRRFVTLEYSEATPGIRNVEATLRLATAFHPALFDLPPLAITK